jgi:glycolate oxidase FAD binding subunit
MTAAGPRDSVDGVAPTFLARPATTDDLVEVMREADERSLTVVARGGGTKLDWGLPPSGVDLLVDVSGMDRVIEHAAGDLVVRVEPGVRLSELQSVLARSGQRLAVDEVVPGSTIGGLVATGLCGPLRLAHGCVRDLLIGVTVVRAGGVLAKSGGRVVKNVAGYDLCKLYAGSYGTLGIVAEAIFRLHPVPASRMWVTASLRDGDEVARCVAAVTGSQLVASALEIDRPSAGAPVEVSVLVEGIAASVDQRAAGVAGLFGSGAEVVPHQPRWWADLPGATTVKVAVPVSELTTVLRAVRDLAVATGTEPIIRGSAGLGVLYAGLPDDEEPGSVAAFVRDLRSACEAGGGSAVVLRAPTAVKDAVDVWGAVPAIDLMRRVKQNFDPRGHLAPGRFVGGI